MSPRLHRYFESHKKNRLRDESIQFDEEEGEWEIVLPPLLDVSKDQLQQVKLTIAQGDLNTVRMLIRKEPRLFSEIGGITLLQFGLKVGALEIADYFISLGADRRELEKWYETEFAKDKDWTYVHRSVIKGNFNHLEQLLFSTPSLILQRDTKRRTLLHAAVLAGRPRLISFILSYIRAKIASFVFDHENSKTYQDFISLADNQGRTALWYAAAKGNITLCRILVNLYEEPSFIQEDALLMQLIPQLEKCNEMPCQEVSHFLKAYLPSPSSKGESAAAAPPAISPRLTFGADQRGRRDALLPPSSEAEEDSSYCFVQVEEDKIFKRSWRNICPPPQKGDLSG
jgi:hypothetical protein